MSKVDEIYEAAEAEGVAEAEKVVKGGTEDITPAPVVTDPNDAPAVTPEPPFELPFPIYDKDGNKLDLKKIKLEALLKGDLSVGYQAMGKEQRKAFADLVRNASQGHWNEHRFSTVQQQLQATLAKSKEYEGQVKSFTEREREWNAALTALIAGDNKPMQRIVEAYQQALTRSGNAPAGFVSQTDAQSDQEAIAAGVQWLQETAMPASLEIAKKYDANPKEVYGAIQYFIQNEPMLTQQRLQEILDYDVPMAFEAKGYRQVDAAAPKAPPTDEIAELKKTIAALQERIAGTANASVASTKDRSKNAPPPGSGTVAGAGDALPSFKSRAQFKAWSAGDPDWAKA